MTDKIEYGTMFVVRERDVPTMKRIWIVSDNEGNFAREFFHTKKDAMMDDIEYPQYKYFYTPIALYTREETIDEKFWENERYIISQHDGTFDSFINIYDRTFSENFDTLQKAVNYFKH